MKCSRIRRWLPLLAGADLPARKARRLEKHLDACANCRAALEETKAALAGIRAVAGRETLDWPEEEWKVLIARAKSLKPRPRRAATVPAFPKRAWAYGFGAVLVLGVAALILRIILSAPPAPLLSEVVASTPIRPSRALTMDKADSGTYPQDVPFKIRGKKDQQARLLLAAKPSPEKTAQDSMSMILVSQETGLKVYWTFNRNFVWKETKR
jgi:hypothetical protein